MTDALLAFAELVSALFLGASQKKGAPEKPTGAFTASLAFFLWGVFFGGPVALLLGGLPWLLSALAALALLAALLAMVRRLGLRLGFVVSVRAVVAYAISFCLGSAALLAVVSPSRLGIHEAKLHSQAAGTALCLPKHFSNHAPKNAA